MKTKVRVMLADERGVAFAGVGVLRLLREIDDKQSIHLAARTCGMSYVKAWTMMNRLDEKLGQPVLERKVGGRGGGGAVLTPFGRRFMSAFDALHREVERTAQSKARRLMQRISLAALLLMGAASCRPAEDIRANLTVAAAANLQTVMPELAAAFEEEYPAYRVTATFGSSGNLVAQLRQGAPFDVFLSADLDYPRTLIKEGLAAPDDFFEYAEGRLVIWARRDAGIDAAALGVEALRHPAAPRIAIANPRHAPYGRAAEQALRSLGLYDDVAGRLVPGENIAQAAQFVESGAAAIGMLAMAQVVVPPLAGAGVYWEVPREHMDPLRQGGVIVAAARERAGAEAFRVFLMGETARVCLREHGYREPEAR